MSLLFYARSGRGSRKTTHKCAVHRRDDLSDGREGEVIGAAEEKEWDSEVAPTKR